MKSQRLISNITLLAIFFAKSSSFATETSWPKNEIGGAEAGFSEQGIIELDAAMEKIVSDQDVAGMVWMLAKDGKIATFETAGFARIDDQAPMTKDTLFRIYSMTKPVTGVALMILHEQGLWNFDDPISKFIPEFENLEVMASYDADGNTELVPLKRQPTMRELLNHSAGFGYGLGG
jgi:CubicO group peptidase (beta-lactamase class C family)